MKKNLIVTLVLMVTIMGLSSFNGSTSHDETARMSFSSMTYDFGQLQKGVPASHSFEFSNPADENIMITKVSASCGCTVTDYTKAEVAPGERGFVKATYNAAKAGVFSKTVSVYHNASEAPIILTIKGEVVE